MEQAIRHYRAWGAETKAALLAERHPELASLELPARRAPGKVSQATSSSDVELDLASLMKASSAMAGEIVMEQLLARLLQLLVENAGAERGALILSESGDLVVEAELWPGAPEGGPEASPELTVARSIPLAEATDICEAVVRYVARTQTAVVLGDASAEGNFRHNAYIQEHRVRSLLSAPHKHQGKLTGVDYPENNRVPRAFTAERCRVLELLSGPAAISLENARLYATLDQRVKQRTEELQESHDDLARTLDRLRDTQKQLVVQEKLASLGALTSGIAHEIKNPLNFVNNFAELSVGLADEASARRSPSAAAAPGDGRRQRRRDPERAAAERGQDRRARQARRRHRPRHARASHASAPTSDAATDLNALIAEKFAALAHHGHAPTGHLARASPWRPISTPPSGPSSRIVRRRSGASSSTW